MAQKKKSSQAEQAVSEVKKNTGSTNSKPASRPKPAAKKNASSGKKKPSTKAEKAAAEKWKLSERELDIVRQLGAVEMMTE